MSGIRCQKHGALCGGAACCCADQHRTAPTWRDRLVAFLHGDAFVTSGRHYLTDRGRFLVAPKRVKR